jgi:hypothetical protein
MVMGAGVVIVGLLDMLSRPRSCRLINHGALLPIEIHGCVDDTIMNLLHFIMNLAAIQPAVVPRNGQDSSITATRLTPGTDIARRQYSKSIG